MNVCFLRFTWTFYGTLTLFLHVSVPIFSTKCNLNKAHQRTCEAWNTLHLVLLSVDGSVTHWHFKKKSTSGVWNGMKDAVQVWRLSRYDVPGLFLHIAEVSVQNTWNRPSLFILHLFLLCADYTVKIRFKLSIFSQNYSNWDILRCKCIIKLTDVIVKFWNSNTCAIKESASRSTCSYKYLFAGIVAQHRLNNRYVNRSYNFVPTMLFCTCTVFPSSHQKFKMYTSHFITDGTRDWEFTDSEECNW